MTEKKSKSGRTQSIKIQKRSKKTLTLAATPWQKPFRIICSECYEEFVVTPKDGVNAILCPECDHGAKAPSDEFLRKLGYHKQRE
ncbi:MAG: hypothetical protein ABIH89_03445, partial [Elusimicrobiota bacterium]